MKKTTLVKTIAFTAAVAAAPAFALDDAVTGAVTAGAATINEGVGQIATVGAAILGLAGTAVVIKWVKAAFFG